MKEIWITYYNMKPDLGYDLYDKIEPHEFEDAIRVIEHSAYEQLQQKLDIAVEALEFVSMPITNHDAISIESLLETMENDSAEAKQALKDIKAVK